MPVDDHSVDPKTRQTFSVYVFGSYSGKKLGLKPCQLQIGDPGGEASIPPTGIMDVALSRDHIVVLTRTGSVFTYGSNEYGVVGHSSEDQEDQPGAVLGRPFPISYNSRIKPIAIAATNWASFLLSDQGQVFGWGTFRGNDGLLGFTRGISVEPRPTAIQGLPKIKQLATGSEHVLALDYAGNVHAWGAGQAGQLGRRVTERRLEGGLRSSRCLTGKRIVHIAAGGRTSFAIAANGDVYAWGLNDFGQCSLPRGGGLEIPKPTPAPALTDAGIVKIACGLQHALGIAADGSVLSWGRCDNAQVGTDLASLPEETLLLDHTYTPRVLSIPTVIPGIHGAQSIAAGDDTGFAVDRDGRVWAWGPREDMAHGSEECGDVEIARIIDMGERRASQVIAFGTLGAIMQSDLSEQHLTEVESRDEKQDD